MITGLGVVSPVGVDVESFWAALLSGQTGAAEVESFDVSPFPTRIGCEVRGLELAARGEPRPGRTALLAVAAGRQALAQAGLAGAGVALSIGTTMERAAGSRRGTPRTSGRAPSRPRSSPARAPIGSAGTSRRSSASTAA